jgi:hypothetical protein
LRCFRPVGLKREHVLVPLLAVHLAFITIVCCRDTFAVFAEGGTLPPGPDAWRHAEAKAASCLGQHLSASNPLRQSIAAYLRCSGIEYGYGYFAPNVPDSFRIVFEIHSKDGRINYEVPTVSGHSTGLRLSTILDNVGRIDYPPLRETLVKMLTYAKWREHPRAMEIRANVGIVQLPNAVQFEQGEVATYKPTQSYHFRFRSEP